MTNTDQPWRCPVLCPDQSHERCDGRAGHLDTEEVGRQYHYILGAVSPFVVRVWWSDYVRSYRPDEVTTLEL